ncbi:hypothetical protein PHYPSEUDO_000213 [Phytophthora pseudosyringae]|uniref:Uncharacterized protein n=1 Tax=Phytophthora pseudosyringae TaxID=221518 RepID=A0A8T1WH24_9STRA|nr:hypothetical protein PHYPSEUDO_000213 [Phytophthora pseudosyringae]
MTSAAIAKTPTTMHNVTPVVSASYRICRKIVIATSTMHNTISVYGESHSVHAIVVSPVSTSTDSYSVHRIHLNSAVTTHNVLSVFVTMHIIPTITWISIVIDITHTTTKTPSPHALPSITMNSNIYYHDAQRDLHIDDLDQNL